MIHCLPCATAEAPDKAGDGHYDAEDHQGVESPGGGRRFGHDAKIRRECLGAVCEGALFLNRQREVRREGGERTERKKRAKRRVRESYAVRISVCK